MRVRLSEPGLVQPLLDFLGRRASCVAARASYTEVEVSLLESLRFDAHRIELERLLTAWAAAHPGAEATVVGDRYGAPTPLRPLR